MSSPFNSFRYKEILDVWSGRIVFQRLSFILFSFTHILLRTFLFPNFSNFSSSPFVLWPRFASVYSNGTDVRSVEFYFGFTFDGNHYLNISFMADSPGLLPIFISLCILLLAHVGYYKIYFIQYRKFLVALRIWILWKITFP